MTEPLTDRTWTRRFWTMLGLVTLARLIYLAFFPYDLVGDEAYYWDWDTHYNAEPFWGTLHHTDARELLADAGFARETISEAWPVPRADGSVVYEPVQDAGGEIIGSTIFGGRKL